MSNMQLEANCTGTKEEVDTQEEANTRQRLNLRTGDVLFCGSVMRDMRVWGHVHDAHREKRRGLLQ